jgi:predicted ABC-type ATPase
LKIKRLRIFAGPNGSGKSTLYPQISTKYPCGVYTNADDIEATLNSIGSISLQNYQLITNQSDFESFYQSHTLHEKAEKEDLTIHISYQHNTLVCQNPNSYAAALIVDFIRHQLMAQGKSFSFETVMSDKTKIDFLQKAKDNGYRIYLYFVATEDVEINIDRIKETRVKSGGHDVHEDKIRNRYIKSLTNLKDAVKTAYRTYIFDNSSTMVRILDIDNGIANPKTNYLPSWVNTYLINK